MNLTLKARWAVGWSAVTAALLFAPLLHAHGIGRKDIGSWVPHALSPTTFAYVANTDDGTISEFKVRANGKFVQTASIALPRIRAYFTHNATGLHRVLVHGTDPQMPLSPAISPNGRFIYFPDPDGGVVLQYQKISDGTLKPLSPPQVVAGDDPNAIALDPTGHFAYVATYSDILQYRISPGGALMPLSSPRVVAGKFSDGNSVAVSHNGQFLYSIGGRRDNHSFAPYVIYQYHINTDGTLQPLNPDIVAAGSNPHGVTVTPNGRFAYAVDFDQGLVLQYKIRPDGTLQLLSPPYIPAALTTHILTPTHPTGVSVSPNGRFVYVVNSNIKALSQFKVGSDGALTPLKPILVPFHAPPVSIAFSSDGRYAYVPNGKTISRFKIAANGTLHPLSPVWVSLHYHPAFLILSAVHFHTTTGLRADSGPRVGGLVRL